ncbi:putative AB hydrolase-1 domain-containing protein [Seiridium cardinale]|uniref:AB hydrolase-1 domain-containing protein n=1 Tax=Seiridium cardinale TaxID=138064 RepID=A0ABR2XR21_9PEZI
MKSNFVAKPGGTKLHYLQSGSDTGPLLICLHGLGGSTETFRPLLPRLPQSYKIILLDFPGFGKSPPPTGPPSVGQHVVDLHHVIKSLQEKTSGSEEKKVVIIGHSLGTVIALHFAAQNPSIVAGLVLIGSARSASHIPFVRQRMLDMAANTRQNGIEWAAELASKSNFPPLEKRQVDDAIRAEVSKAVAGSDPEAYALTCEMMVDESHEDPDYSKITCPAVLVAGDLDVISPVERSTGLAKLLGSKPCWVEVVMSGHQPILEDAEGVAGAVERLLEKV